MNSQVRVCQSQHYNKAPLRVEFINIHLFLHRWHSTPLHNENTATPRTSHLTNKCNKILGIKLIVGFYRSSCDVDITQYFRIKFSYQFHNLNCNMYCNGYKRSLQIHFRFCSIYQSSSEMV